MPTKRRTRKTLETKPPTVEETLKQPVRLPESYHGPAFQLEDGRTLYVGRWITPDQWAVLFLIENGDRDRFKSPELPVVTEKREAIANLLHYGSKNQLSRVQ